MCQSVKSGLEDARLASYGLHESETPISRDSNARLAMVRTKVKLKFYARLWSARK